MWSSDLILDWKISDIRACQRDLRKARDMEQRAADLRAEGERLPEDDLARHTKLSEATILDIKAKVWREQIEWYAEFMEYV